MGGDGGEASKQREGLDPRHIMHAAQPVLREDRVGRGGIRRKQHVEKPPLRRAGDLDEMTEVHARIGLRLGMAPGGEVMACGAQEHAKFYLPVAHIPSTLYSYRDARGPDCPRH